MFMKFQQYLAEGIRAQDFENAVSKIVSYLQKHIGKLYRYNEIEQFNGSTGSGFGLRYFTEDGRSIRFNWKRADTSSSLESISLWTGKTPHPNYVITGPEGASLGSISLASALPALVKAIKSPSTGKITIGESKSLTTSDTLSEAVLFEDAFDDVKSILASGVFSRYTLSKQGRFQERIFSDIVTKHPDWFDVQTDAAGRQRFTFTGSLNDITREEFGGAGGRQPRGGGYIQMSSAGNETTTTEGERRAEQTFRDMPDRVPFEEQLEDMQTIVGAVVKGASNFAVILGAGGLGKALPNHYPVLTPTGWTPIGELLEGDDVIAQDGTTTKVLGVYPQGILPTMTITFADGRVVDCSADHLWEVNINGKDPVVLDTKTIKQYVDGEIMRLDRRVTVPLFEPTQGVDIDLPIDPYLLGALIGDGHLSKTITFTNADPDVLDSVRATLAEGYVLRQSSTYQYDYFIRMENPTKDGHIYGKALKELGLFDKTSQYKFIPQIYKDASLSQKQRLIQGLIDTDGTVEKKGTMQYCTSSPQLAKDVQELVFSIGGKCRIYTRQTHYTKNNERVECLPTYILTIQYHSIHSLVACKRKLDRLSDDPQYKDVQLPIISVEWTGIEEECTCIKIDHPRALYVTKDYVPTHNTHNVEKTLHSLGLQDGEGYFKNTSSGSPSGLFKTLFINRTGIVVLDDCDTLLNTQEGRNLLKAALDTKKRRKLVWGKSAHWLFDPADEYEAEAAQEAIDQGLEPEKFPRYYDYEGRVILISNLTPDQLDPDGALSTRGFVLTLDPTREEVFSYMQKILPEIEVEGNLPEDSRIEVLELIKKQTGDVNIRKLVRGLNMAASGVPNWQRIVQRYC